MLKISFLLASRRSKTKIAGSRSISQMNGSADPDPDQPQNVMDPQHCCQVVLDLDIFRLEEEKAGGDGLVVAQAHRHRAASRLQSRPTLKVS